MYIFVSDKQTWFISEYWKLVQVKYACMKSALGRKKLAMKLRRSASNTKFTCIEIINTFFKCMKFSNICYNEFQISRTRLKIDVYRSYFLRMLYYFYIIIVTLYYYSIIYNYIIIIIIYYSHNWRGSFTFINILKFLRMFKSF